MSADLRRLLETAAETGPLPDVDAIVTQVRRRHRRRVAVSVGVGVLAGVIAVATLWQPKQQARDTVVSPPAACPKPAAPDISHYAPTYLPEGYTQSEGSWVDAGSSYHRTYMAIGLKAFASPQEREIGIARLTLTISRRSAVVGIGLKGDNRQVGSVGLDCGSASVWASPTGRALVWQLDAGTDAVLSIQAETASVTPTPPSPALVTSIMYQFPVSELERIARSVALR